MAVLKDLIVHGRSRFVNGAQFNTINAESIGAEQGIFNKLIATTLDAKEATIDNLTAQNATVVGLLDVQGELHTNAWTNANIANIGGSFYISPTVEPTDGTTTISITRNSATSWTVSASGTFATDFIKSGTATSGVAWPANSLVLITGDVVVGNMVYPLGTLKGTLSSQVTATAATTSKTITITGVTDAQNNNSPSVLQELYELNGNANISNAIYKNGKISLYKLGSNPIGILLSSMGTNSNSIIDIYGGVSTNPTVRIGHLAGLPNVNGSAPTGWGIYTDNGYFSGVIVSTSGKIGGFTIGANDIHNGKTSKTETNNNGIWVGTDGIGFGKGVTYFSIDGTGKIGPWTLSTAYFRNGNIASATNTTVSGVYLGTDGLNISNGTAATTSYITKSAVNIGNKLTWNGTTTTLSVTGAINATSLSTGTKISSTSGTGTYIDSSGNIYSGSGSANNFTVTSAGTLIATGASIAGNITATQGFTVTSSVGGQTLASMTGSGIQLGPVTGTSHYNVFIDANGINLRYDSNILNKVDSTGMKVYSSDGKKFLQSGTNGLHVYNGSVTEVAVLGYANGTAESGMADAPYFTLGTRSGTIGNWSGCFGAGTASGYMSFIQGKGNTASNNYTMARGSGCTASGLRAFASGYNCTASGTDSIAMGSNCQATSSDSKALGYYCNSTYSDLFVVGKYNNPTSGDLFEVGDGSSSSRRNAFRVNGSGDAYVRNALYLGGHASQVGDYKVSEVSTRATVASGTESETGCSVSLGAGTWVVGYIVSFVAGNGTRTCSLYNGSSYINYSRTRLAVASTGYTILNNSMMINLTSAATINLYAGHAGVSSSQTYNASLRAVRIA